MSSFPARSLRRGIFVGAALLSLASAASAQTETWTGASTNSPANYWIDPTNWSPNTVPGLSGNTDIAAFSVIGNSNTSISLNGAALTPSSIQFGTSGSGINSGNGTNASAYTIGSSTNDGSFTFSGAGNGNNNGGGLIDLGPAVSTAQVINSPLLFTGTAPSIIVNEGLTGATLTINGAVSLGSGVNNISVASPAAGQTNGSPVTIINGLISGAGSIAINGGASNTGTGVGVADTLTAGTYEPTAQNTYSGGTTIAAQNPIILVAANSMGSPGAVTSGPFGTGTISITANNPRFRPAGGSFVIYNAINQVSLNSFAMESNQSNDPNSVTFAGPITSPSGGTYNVNGFTNSEGFSTPLYGATMIFGLASNPSAFALATSGNTRFNALTGPIVINDKITGAPTGNNAVVFNSQNVISTSNGADMYSVQINNPNSTYTGNTFFGNATNSTTPMGAILIGASTVGSPGAIASGPFGLSTLYPANSNSNSSVNEAPPNLVPVGADQTLANNLVIGSSSAPNTNGSGFMVSNAWTNTINIQGTVTSLPNTDPTGNHNLFLTGTITVATGKVIDNNMAPGVALYFGGPTTAASPSTFSLGASTNTLKIQSNMAGVGGVTIINDVVSGSGNLTVQGGAVVQLNNINTYTGATLVIGAGGPGNIGGPGAVGTGGTLGGTGTIVGLVTIGSTTASSQGGIIYPGPGTTPGTSPTAGTLTVPAMSWQPFGRYVFTYNATNVATGGGVNGFINGTGTLDLSTLAAGNTFDINLLPLSTAPTSTPQTYTIASFAGGIPGFSNSMDISSLFTFSGTFTGTPDAVVVAGAGGGSAQAIQLTFTPPASTSLAISTWTGTTSGNWSIATNWNPAAVPASSLNTQLVFGATPNAAMTNDIPGTFTLNAMTFNAGSPVYTLAGNGLNFATNSSGGLPQIVSNSANGVTLNVPFTFTNNLTVSGSGNVTLGGAVGGASSLTMSGSGVLTLSVANSYAGGTNIQNGTVQVAADSALGTGNVTGSTLGTLSVTGTTTTARQFAMNGGTIAVAAGKTLTFNGSLVTSAILDGSGTFATSAANGGQFFNTTTTSSVSVVSNNSSDRFVHFDNSGAFSLAAGVNTGGNFNTTNLNGFTNEGTGSITIGAGSQLNVANFQSYGMMNLTPATVSGQFTELANLGTAPLGFNGGSQTFVGTATAPNAGVVGVDLHGQNMVIQGGLFVNNGLVFTSTGSSTIFVDYGATYKGAGTTNVPIITQNGGKVLFGNSPGNSTLGSLTFGPGGIGGFDWQINDAGPSEEYPSAPGVAGPTGQTVMGAPNQVSGWSEGLVTIQAGNPSRGIPGTTGAFTWTATPTNQFDFQLETLVGPYTTVGTATDGQMSDFTSEAYVYRWEFINFQGPYSGPTSDSALTASTLFDTTLFANPLGGGIFVWDLVLNGGTGPGGHLDLVYVVPEPGTLALTGLAGLAVGWVARRRQIAR